MRAVLARRDAIADAARRFAPTKRYWAVVGSGANKVAAEEVRIKLSELCYKSIACDVIEDKKHIDLSSEPLILVCAAGLAGSTADDVGKEVAIFRAHKATPIVIADDGDARYPAAAVIAVPAVDPALGFVLSAMAGHLFGYEAALAIDATARPLREAMEVIEQAVSEERSADVVLDPDPPGASPASPSSTSTGCAATATTATSRRARRCAWPGCCATCCPTVPSRSTRRDRARSAHRPPSSTTSCSP